MTSYNVPSASVDAVARDGLPRLVQDEKLPDVQHVLFLDGDKVRSMLAADWPPPLPTEPTQAQSAAAVAAKRAAEQAERQSAIALRASILNTANDAAGVRLSALTPAQVRALLACVLWKVGGVNSDLTVRSLSEWL